MTTTPEKIDRIVTLRAFAPVAITVDLSTPAGAQLAAIPEQDWLAFLTGFLRHSVAGAFRVANTREDGTIGGVRLDLGPEAAWDVPDVLADIDRKTGEIILPPEAELAHIELVNLIAQLTGVDLGADDLGA